MVNPRTDDTWDVIVIGGGLAGAAAAAQLAQAGKNVLLVEKQPGPHDKVCGEFISIEAQRDLLRLGVDISAAESIGSVRLSGQIHSVANALPFVARSLTRRLLDEAMLQRAIALGATVLRGVAVTALEKIGDAWQVTTAGSPYSAPAVMLATGKHDLRSFARADGAQNDLIGFKILATLDTPLQGKLAGQVELGFFPGGYAGLQPVENGRANLCLLVSKRQFAACDKNWPALLMHILDHTPRLRHLLQGAAFQWGKPLAVYGIPYGFIHRDQGADGGLYRIGDQLAVIPSFSGDGMAIALHTARHAVQHYLNGSGSRVFHLAMHRQLRWQIRLATGLSQLAVRPWGQHLLLNLCRRFPSLLAKLALLTRIA